MPDYDPTVEYQLTSRAGLSFDEILASPTTAPEARLGSGRRGTVAAGSVADLVVLDDDPADAAASLSSVRYTVRSGRVVFSRE